VTKEHREHLAEGAKKRLTQAKQDLRNIQHKFQKIVGEKQLSAQVLVQRIESYELCGSLVKQKNLKVKSW
jgi:hypothetical protein